MFVHFTKKQGKTLIFFPNFNLNKNATQCLKLSEKMDRNYSNLICWQGPNQTAPFSILQTIQGAYINAHQITANNTEWFRVHLNHPTTQQVMRIVTFQTAFLLVNLHLTAYIMQQHKETSQLIGKQSKCYGILNIELLNTIV